MIEFRQITYDDTKPFLLNKHYLHRMPSISYAYGIFKNGELGGVITYGIPASHSLVVGIAGKRYASHVLELNRLYIDDAISQDPKEKNITSKFVSYSLKQLKPLNKIIISYADEGMHHVGYIYQATNFYYTGETKSRTDRFAGFDKHSRHYDKDKKQYLRVLRTSKYRYLYITGNKKFKREAIRALNYCIYPEYPKGNNRHYQVGDTKPTYFRIENNKKIVDEKTAKKYMQEVKEQVID